jgi:large subunit ribosomal protein L21
MPARRLFLCQALVSGGVFTYTLPPFNPKHPSSCIEAVLPVIVPARPASVKPDEQALEESPMTYAIIEAGGKQHRVQPGETLKVEKIEAATGESINFDKVLLVSDGQNVKIGAPYVAGGKVTAEVVSQGRHDKVTIIKFRRRKHHMKRAGHRQWYTEIKITGITG